MTTLSSILAWEIPWTEKPSGPRSSSVQPLSRVRLFVTPWTAARQASLSITNSRSSWGYGPWGCKKVGHDLVTNIATTNIYIFIYIHILFGEHKLYFQEFLHTLFCLLFITVHWIDSFVFTYKLPIFFINDKLPSS